MSDTWLSGYLVAMAVIFVIWWQLARWIASRIRRRHAPRAMAIFGTPERRKNGMDQFFSLIGFLFQDQSNLRDLPLLLACVLLKVLAILWLLTFVAMSFTPMFLKLGH
jgi:hypothetical protein